MKFITLEEEADSEDVGLEKLKVVNLHWCHSRTITVFTGRRWVATLSSAGKHPEQSDSISIRFVILAPAFLKCCKKHNANWVSINSFWVNKQGKQRVVSSEVSSVGYVTHGTSSERQFFNFSFSFCCFYEQAKNLLNQIRLMTVRLQYEVSGFNYQMSSLWMDI